MFSVTGIIIGIGLLLFGIGYNYLVEWLEQHGFEEGYTAILVVGGVLVTLLASIPLVGVETFLTVLAYFAVSGLPMVLGSWQRYCKRRNQEREQARLEALGALGGQSNGYTEKT